MVVGGHEASGARSVASTNGFGSMAGRERFQFVSLAMDSGNAVGIGTGGAGRGQGRLGEPVTVNGFIDVRRTVWTAAAETG